MKARIVSAQIRPGKTNEAIAIYRDSVVPAAKQHKGFKAALLLTDPDAGKALSITLWETDADMTSGEASGFLKEQITKFGAVFSAPPGREHYDVSVQG